MLASPAPFGSGRWLGAEAPALQYTSPQALVQHASRPSPNPQHAGHHQPAPQRRLQPKPGPEKPPTTQTNLATDETQTEPKGHRHGSAPAKDSITCRRCRILLALASSFRVNPLGPSSSTQCPVTSLPALIMLQAIPCRFNSLACRSSNILQSFAHIFTSLPAQLLPTPYSSQNVRATTWWQIKAPVLNDSSAVGAALMQLSRSRMRHL